MAQKKLTKRIGRTVRCHLRVRGKGAVAAGGLEEGGTPIRGGGMEDLRKKKKKGGYVARVTAERPLKTIQQFILARAQLLGGRGPLRMLSA